MSHINLDKIQESTKEEPKVDQSIQFGLKELLRELTYLHLFLIYLIEEVIPPSYIDTITEANESLIDSNQSILAIGSYDRP